MVSFRVRTFVVLSILLSGLSVVSVASATSEHSTSGQLSVSARAEKSSTLPWQNPADTALNVLRGFDPPAVPWGSGHRGVDLAVNHDIHAPAAGVVHFAGWVVNRPVISVRHDTQTISSFEPVASELQAGDRVQAGDIIGQRTDDHSHCARPCVHWGVRVEGDYVNPLRFLQQTIVVLLE